MVVRKALTVAASLGALAGGALVAVSAASDPKIDLGARARGARMHAVPAGSALVRDAGVNVGAFEIDSKEISVAEYALCVRAGACRLHTSAADPSASLTEQAAQSGSCVGGRPDRLDEPMNCVDRASAEAYCRWAGKRLPTRDEWWLGVGNRHPGAASELHRARVTESWFAAEWTSSPAKVTKTPEPRLGVLGHWRSGVTSNQRPFEAYEDWLPIEVRSPWIGFRCAR